MCDEIAATDARVKVIHQENKGVAAARQHGLESACGEYVIHADPDDWVDLDMIEQLYGKAVKDDADMVICDFYVEEQEYGTYYMVQKPSALGHFVVQRELFQFLHGSCWNKLVRRTCYNDFDIRFPEGISYCEDVCVNVALLNHDIHIAYLPKAFYHYDQYSNSNSLVATPNYGMEHYERDKRLLQLLLSITKDEKAHELCRINYTYSIMVRAFKHRMFSSIEYRRRFRRDMCYVWKSKATKSEKIAVSLACLGLSPLAHLILNGYCITKKRIKKLITYK